MASRRRSSTRPRSTAIGSTVSPASCRPASTPPPRARPRQNLSYAAPLLQAAGITLLIEPINTRDVPGFFLSGTAQAIEIMDAVGSDNLELQYDIYHMQIMEGDLAKTIERLLPRSATCSSPMCPAVMSRAPASTSVAVDHIDRLGYHGWIGASTYRRARPAMAWAGPRRT